MNELDGDIRRFLTRLTDAAPDAPDAGALVDRSPPPTGRPTARLVGIAAVVALAAGGLAITMRGDGLRSSLSSDGSPTTLATCVYELSMPDLLGLTRAEAESRMAAWCFGGNVRIVEVPAEDRRPRTVVEQSPMAGAAVQQGVEVVLSVTVASVTGSPCTLPGAACPSSETTVAAPLETCPYVPITMPDIVGRPLDEARAALAKPCVEVSVDVHEVPIFDAAPGTVLTQSIRAGANVQFRGSVSVEVATASATDAVCPLVAARVLPSVVGMTTDGARSVLGTPCLRFTLVTEEVTDPSVPPGVILEQRPGAGTLVQPGSTVRLWVAAARSEARGFYVVGSFDLGLRRRVVELEPTGLCISQGDDATRGCDELPPPVVFIFGRTDDPQEMWGLLDPGLTIKVERDGVAVPVQQTTEPVGGHLAFFGLVPAGGRVTVMVTDGSGTVVKRVDDVAR